MSDTLNFKKYWQNPSYRFVVLFLGLFVLLYYFTIFFMGIAAPGNYYSPFVADHLDYVRGFRHLLIAVSASVIRLFGYEVFTSDTTLHAFDAGGITVVYSCLGFGVMSFFVAFVLAWPKKTIKSKLWFIPVGLILIQVLNIARFIMITLFWRTSSYRSLIDHHTLFNFILYVILLATIYFWINSHNKKAIS
jgi:exosortase/archaeosortase family protein